MVDATVLTTEQVRSGYAYDSRYGDYMAGDENDFDGWLADHDTKVRAETMTQAQQVVTKFCRDNPDDYCGDVPGRILAAMNKAYLP